MEVYEEKDLLSKLKVLKSLTMKSSEDVKEIVDYAIEKLENTLKEDNLLSLDYIKKTFLEQLKDDDIDVADEDTVQEAINDFCADYVLTDTKCYELMANLDAEGYGYNEFLENYGYAPEEFKPQIVNDMLVFWMSENWQDWIWESN